MDTKALRLGLGMSQDKFAKELGVAPFTVRRWEKGGKPSPLAQEKLDKLAKAVKK